jgi:hypothetical protein
MKHFLYMMLALVMNFTVGAAVGQTVGLDPLVCAGGATGIGMVMSFAPMPMGLRVGVLTEVWTGELIKALRSGLEGSWLDGVPDQSSVVNNDVIHLVDVGADPTVLINNTTYPIDIEELKDGDKAISLDKFQTKATPVTDDELYALSYDKMSRVKESHSNAINDAKFRKAAHALCAKQNSKTTPVLTATGAADENGRKRLTMADIVEMKRALDKLKVPAENRRLVLCPDHVNDLLLTDQNFREQYNVDRATGKVGKVYGFDVYEYADNPIYTAKGVKKDVGATADAGEYQCSFAFYTPRVFKATGSTKMYYSEASTDPQNQRNLIDFRHYFIVLPKKEDAGVVMLSTMETATA